MSENSEKSDADSSVRHQELIRIALKNVMKEIAAGVSLSDFQQNVTILKSRPTLAKNLYDIHIAGIIQTHTDNIETLHSGTGIDTKYNEITNLINDSTAHKNSVAWRPTPGDCNMQLAAYRKKSLIETKKKLEKLVEEQRSTRILLKKSLSNKRAQIESLQKDMDTAKTKLYRNSIDELNHM